MTSDSQQNISLLVWVTLIIGLGVDMNKMKLRSSENIQCTREKVFIGIGALVNKTTFKGNGHKKGNACWKVGTELYCYGILFATQQKEAPSILYFKHQR